jgi:hemolysin III
MQISFRDEETVNAATHAAGLACGVAAAAFLVWTAAMRGSAWQICGCTIYATTLVIAYAASTLSHAFRGPRLSHAFRIADQAVIFLLIGGTYTPVALSYLRGGGWWALHCAIWGIALFGFVSKAGFAHRVTLGAVSITLYVLLGWLPVLFTPLLIGVVPGRLLLWFLAGGLAYMAGTLFFMYDNRVRYFHAAWHLMVVLGSTLHFIGILLYCTASR